ncbi:MAG: hypothetical protein JWM93_1614 [Frankiales bacterium]|nr:hypothetical protein [Frankiales bacterium]
MCQSPFSRLDSGEHGAARREHTRNRSDEQPDEEFGLDRHAIRCIGEQPDQRPDSDQPKNPGRTPEAIDGEAVVAEFVIHAVNLTQADPSVVDMSERPDL